jgi:hypothetical protein
MRRFGAILAFMTQLTVFSCTLPPGLHALFSIYIDTRHRRESTCFSIAFSDKPEALCMIVLF